jgi:transcriptional regulator with XRE-family HTH domain
MKKTPRPRGTTLAKHTLSYQLREIIEARGLTAYAAARMAEVDPGVVSRFMTGERDIRMGTADRLAAALGLRLVELARKGRGRPGRSAVASPPLPVDTNGAG